MPTKHIDDLVWREVEKKTVEAVVLTQKPIKETTMLKWLIRKGLKEITEEDIRAFTK